jgi:hypothetical protein
MSIIEIKRPKRKPANLTDPELLVDMLQQTEESGQVTVHVTYPPAEHEILLRIWRSTYLISRTSLHKSRLLHAENISIAPLWTPVNAGVNFNFTLLFEALPKDVFVFDLAELIPQSGGFFYSSIVRNNEDVYRIMLNPGD